MVLDIFSSTVDKVALLVLMLLSFSWILLVISCILFFSTISLFLSLSSCTLALREETFSRLLIWCKPSRHPKLTHSMIFLLQFGRSFCKTKVTFYFSSSILALGWYLIYISLIFAMMLISEKQRLRDIMSPFYPKIKPISSKRSI